MILSEKLKNLELRFFSVAQKKDIKNLKKKLASLNTISSKEGFWNDQGKAQSLMQQKGGIEKEIADLEGLNRNLEDVKALLNDYVSDSGSAAEHKEIEEDEVFTMIESELEKLNLVLDEIELTTFFRGKFDENNTIFHIFAGQGGTEAMDWADMLLRMYTRFCNSKSWELTIVDEVRGSEAGISSVTLEIKGRYSYGYLKHEHGTHRLVRLSPFNAQGLRQTSFAGVEVAPLVENDIDIEIKSEDIKFSAVRSSGAGGQNVNKVASKVRLVHLPTGIAVESSAFRTQPQNKETAMRLLKSKLYLIEEEKRKKTMESEKGKYNPASWGNQIRNYILHPYKLVKDTRTKVETSAVNAVLDGDIQMFIDAAARNL